MWASCYISTLKSSTVRQLRTVIAMEKKVDERVDPTQEENNCYAQETGGTDSDIYPTENYDKSAISGSEFAEPNSDQKFSIEGVPKDLDGQIGKVGKQCFKIPEQNIVLVDDTESFNKCQEAVSKNGASVGIDTEWKPVKGPQRVSIMQLSLRDKVFILLVGAITKNVAEALILAFGNTFFANENVQKLGKDKKLSIYDFL